MPDVTIPMTMDEEALRDAYALVAAHLNRVADIWERDGNRARTRITREYANAYRAYAEGYGGPHTFGSHYAEYVSGVRQANRGG